MHGSHKKSKDGRLTLLALLALGLGAASCFPKTAATPGPLSAAGVTWASTRWPGVTAGALSAGRDHFVAKCNGCHGYPDLGAVPEGRWPEILESMAKKAGLAAEQREAVLHFVLASRAEQAGR
jgi:hypothetical protein